MLNSNKIQSNFSANNLSASAHNDSAHEISSEVVGLLFKDVNKAFVASTLVAAIMLFALKNNYSNFAAIIWVMLLLAAYTNRYIVCRNYLSDQSQYAHTQLWLKRFRISTFLCGLAWGSVCLFIFPAQDILLQAFLALILAGVVSGGLFTYAVDRITALCFASSIALLASPAYLMSENQFSKLILLIASLFILYLVVENKRLAKGMLDNITLRINAVTQGKAISDLSERQSLHMEHTPMGVIEWDANLNITSWNTACTSIFGYGYQEVLGKHISFLIADLENLSPEKAVQALLSQESIQNNLKKVVHKNDDAIFCEWHNTVLKSADGKVIGLASLVQDKTAFIKTQNKIHQLAYYDTLTNLPNRGLLLDRLNQAITHCERSQSYGLVVYVDLDHFKSMNDAKGHAAGDHLLITIANRLQNAIRKQDTVARIGGDEFVLVLSDIGKTEVEAQIYSRKIMDKIVSSIRIPVDFDHYQHNSSASIGICMFNSDAISADELVRRADMAMYISKQHGRSGFQYYDETMQPKYDYQQELKNDLNSALEKNEFQLYLQGQFDRESNYVGAEVLLRWQHPTHGTVSPLDFIPLTEESGLIVPIGRWVLHQACALLKEWEASPLTNKLTLSVNVSAVQFNQISFINEVESALQSSACNPTLLCLELTESAVVNSVEDIIYKMNYISSMGIALSIDDFGIGYSSLSVLKRLPLNELKIDKSFINDIIQSSSAGTIAQTILQMGKNLDLHIVAEGVETQHQKQYLQNNGCEVFQGYLLGKPCHIADFEKAVTERESLAA